MKGKRIIVNKRTISSLILTFIIITILVINNSILNTIIVVLLSILGIYEYNKAFKHAGYHPIEWVGYLSSLSIFFIDANIDADTKIVLIKVLLPILVILMFVYIILKNLKVNIIDLAITFLSVAYIPLLFSFIKLIISMEHGRILLIYVLLGAFMSDVMAFLVGSKFGKKKLCPKISPKKTVEGALAGIIGVIISYIALCIISNAYFNTDFNVIYISILGIVASIGGQFGDLAESSIKRFCDIKDSGNLIPGHGGILDRFDSIMFVAPIIYIFFKVYIGI